MKQMKYFFAILVFSWTSNICLQADEVTDAIDKARKAYDSKDYALTSQELNSALSGIQKLISQEVIQCLPGPMEGWERTEPSSSLADQGPFGMISTNSYSVEVNFSTKEPAQQITISISNIPHIVQIAKAGIQLLSNPYFAKMQKENQPEEKLDTYKLGEFEGAKVSNEKQQRAEITLFYGDLMVQIKGSGVKDLTTVEKLAQEVNYDKLKGFSANKEAANPPMEKAAPAEQKPEEKA